MGKIVVLGQLIPGCHYAPLDLRHPSIADRQRVSLTHDSKVFSAIGSANIVNFCHVNTVPVYLFANTLFAKKLRRDKSPRQEEDFFSGAP